MQKLLSLFPSTIYKYVNSKLGQVYNAFYD